MNRNDDRTKLSFMDLVQEFCVVREVATFAQRAWTWPVARTAENKRSILLIPGFLAGDATLYPFADWLRARGHQVYFSGILANADCPVRALERLGRILQDRVSRSGEKLVVIGHSLGGIYARELARRYPNLVDQVILLGSPIHEPHKHSNPFVKMLATVAMRVNEIGCHCPPDRLATVCGVLGSEPPQGIRETLIYSKSDGVVDWESCIEEGACVEAVEVKSTHCGIPYNMDTLRIIRERIERDGQPEDPAAIRAAQAGMQSV